MKGLPMKKFLDRMNEVRSQEEGFTLVEVMVAVTIIAIVLAASGMALMKGFEAQAAAEMRSVADSVATEQINDIKDKSYTATRLIKTNDVILPDYYNAEWTVSKTIDQPTWTDTLEAEGVQYEEVEIVNDNNYSVRTYVTRVNQSSFDNAGNNIQLNRTTINGMEVVEPVVKRVTVIVTWFNGVETLTTQKTWVRTPSPAECIPPRFHATGNAGNDKWDTQERIQACEDRK